MHQRVNVRVLELIHGPSGDAVELEGPRLPGFHAGSVIDALHDHYPTGAGLTGSARPAPG